MKSENSDATEDLGYSPSKVFILFILQNFIVVLVNCTGFLNL